MQATTASNAVTLSATQTAKSTTTAKADAVNGSVVIGLALGLAVPDDEVTATNSRTLTAKSLTLTATGSQATDTNEADASATGAQGTGDDTSGKDVNGKATDQVKNANQESSSTTGKSSSTTDTNNAKATTSDSNGSGGNTVTVAGAAAINIAKSITQASLADGSNVTATGGPLTLKTQNNADASAKGSGKADSAGTVGIGVGVAVNKFDITNLATTGNSIVVSKGLDVEAGVLVNGQDRIQRFDGKSWSTIDQGATFPEAPKDGDFFQLTTAQPATTTVDGASQSLSGGTLKVKSTAAFGTTGTLKFDGIDGTCSYSVTDSTDFSVSGTACTGTPDDKSTVTMTTATTVNGGSQDLSLGSLTVTSTADFDPAGGFMIGTSTCTYTSVLGNTFLGVAGCTGTPKDGSAVTRVSFPVGVYKWNDSTSLWVFQNKGIPSGSTLPAAPAVGDYFQITKAAPANTAVDGPFQDLSSGTLVVKSTNMFGSSGAFKVDGVTGTCDYTGITLTSFTGITGCTGLPADKAGVTAAAPVTTVSVGGQSLAGGTLTVASTAGFASSGAFKVDAIKSTCNYTGTTATTFTGITGCTGTPALSANVTSTATPPTYAAGIYRFDGTKWNSLGDGTALPASPASNDYYRLAENDVIAEADSGAGGDKDKVSIAGALALNILSNNTEAIVPSGANVTATGGDVTLKALSNEEDTAKADSDAKAGKVGIGASAAIQVLNANTVTATIQDGATFTGGNALTITSTFHHDVETEDKAGTEGGIAISPAVSLAIVGDTTSAHLGSGNDLTVTGDATIQASEDFTSNLKTDAAAAGSDVAVGAAVGINAVTTTVKSDVSRNLSAGAITIGATTTSGNDVEVMASAKGEKSSSDGGKSADTQTNDKLNSNPDTTGKANGSTPSANNQASTGNSSASGQSGDSGGGVGVAAGVALNWVQGSNTAEVNDGVHLTGTGAVKVSAQDTTDETAKAIANAFDTSLSQSDARIGAAVGFNYVDFTNTAIVGQDAQITGNGVMVEAVSPSENDFITWGVSAAGGKSDAGVAASVAIQVITFKEIAQVKAGAHITSSDYLTVQANDTLGLQSIAVGGDLTVNGVGVGGAIIVNVLPAVNTQALVESDTSSHITRLDALNGISVVAHMTFKPLAPVVAKITLPAVTSVAAGGAAASGDPAVSGSVIVEVLSFTTEAHIAAGAQVNQHPLVSWLPGSTQTVDVIATDDTSIVNLAGSLSLSTGSAAVGIGLVVDIIDKTTTAYLGGTGTNVAAGWRGDGQGRLDRDVLRGRG